MTETLSKFGSGLFLLVQMIILLDFTHTWNDAWVVKDEQFQFVLLFHLSDDLKFILLISFFTVELD
jgi:hypothetical protein